MTLASKAKDFRPATGEAPFGLDEVFFSRTDKRGVLQAANHVFARVSHYDWAQLLGAPHRIVRHPDMPRGVFRLFWDRIQRGEQMGAYIKNRASDGLYYWVFAMVVPTRNGYVSARLKPSSPLLAEVSGLYADLRAQEHEGLSPGDSAERLLEKIAAMGFDSYERFVSCALATELVARGATLGHRADASITRFRRMLDAADALKADTSALIREFEASRITPHNMRLLAARMEFGGGPITTLSTNYGLMSRQMSEWFERNVSGPHSNFALIGQSVIEGLFLDGTAQILTECSAQLEQERALLGKADIVAEQRLLDDLAQDYRERAAAGRRRVAREAGRIRDACDTMHRFMVGLSTTQIMCRIEAARQSGEGRESLHDVISQLNGFQSRIEGRLQRIAERSAAIEALAQGTGGR